MSFIKIEENKEKYKQNSRGSDQKLFTQNVK